MIGRTTRVSLPSSHLRSAIETLDATEKLMGFLPPLLRCTDISGFYFLDLATVSAHPPFRSRRRVLSSSRQT